MTEKYVCSICEKEYNNLDDYLKCVSTCGTKLKKEQEAEIAKKYAEEVNAAINKVKSAKDYYEQQLKEFKEKYPNEYKLNFGKHTCSCNSHTCNCKNESDSIKQDTEKESFKDISFSYVDDGKDKPKLSARVNGVKVDDDSINKLFDDPDTRYIAKMLGII